MPIKAVQALQDHYGNWYIVPNEIAEDFESYLEDDDLHEFEERYGKYATGGDLNLVQLYAKIPE
jgi:hypothetical protein